MSNTTARKPKDAPALLEVSGWSHVDSSASPTVPLKQVIVTSNKTTTPTVSAQNNNTAIVFTTAYLTECKAMRLEHLLQTAPSSMDIWLLHNHNVTKKIYPNRFQKSSTFLRILKERFPRLHEVNQQSEPLVEFDTIRSGTSKSSFVKWLVSHPIYQHAWNLEDDILFTGRWDLFFEEYGSRDDDVIGVRGRRKSHWEQYKSCHFDRITSAIEERSKNETNITTINSTVIDRVQCKEVASLGVLWPMFRLSSQAAALLLDDIQSGALRGHHEAVIHPLMLRHRRMTFHDIMGGHIGVVEAGGWGRFRNARKLKLAFYEPVSSNRIYHPVKCEAYEDNSKSMVQFQDILTSFGPFLHGIMYLVSDRNYYCVSLDKMAPLLIRVLEILLVLDRGGLFYTYQVLHLQLEGRTLGIFLCCLLFTIRIVYLRYALHPTKELTSLRPMIHL